MSQNNKHLINIQVSLNEQNVPTDITWQASDNPENKDFQPCKAMLLSLFDKDHKDTLKIDLWTTEMQVAEMDRFFYQTLRGLSDTYLRATNNKDLAEAMRQFVQYFGEQTEIVPIINE